MSNDKEKKEKEVKDKSLGADGMPKFFFSQEKADAFIDRKGLGDTHHAVGDGSGRFEILPKQVENPVKPRNEE